MAGIFLAASPALAVDRSKELSEEERAALAITAVERVPGIAVAVVGVLRFLGRI